jgi:hypothetical protein
VWGKLWGKNKKHPKVLDLLDNLAGQNAQHHKPPVVQKSQVFCFWSAEGILTASELLLFVKYERQHLAYITM